jgi:hypothetical protein
MGSSGNGGYDRRRTQLASALRRNAVPLSQALYNAVRDEACATWKVPQ